MEDDNFVRRLEHRDLSFAKGDILRMRLRSRTYVTDGTLRTENKVLEVLEVLSQPKPLPLLPAIQVDQELIPSPPGEKEKGKRPSSRRFRSK